MSFGEAEARSEAMAVDAIKASLSPTGSAIGQTIWDMLVKFLGGLTSKVNLMAFWTAVSQGMASGGALGAIKSLIANADTVFPDPTLKVEAVAVLQVIAFFVGLQPTAV